MRRIFLLTVTLSFPFACVNLWAQDPARRMPPLGAALTASALATPADDIRPATITTGTNIALIDIGHILKNHARYKASRDALQAKGKALQASANEQAEQLNAQASKLKDFQPGSLEFKRLEAELAQRHSDTRVKLELERRGLVDEEVKLYYRTYQEVQEAVKEIAEQYNIQLVLRFDGEKMDPADPDSIRRGLINSVVFQRNLDITELVLKSLNPPVANRGGNSLR